MAEGAPLLLRLYRSILRVHMHKLPGPMRTLGDDYVRSEFRAHVKAHGEGRMNEAQWRVFFKQWGDYVAMLQGEGADKASPLEGSDLAPDVWESMSDSQRQRMEQLREEAATLGSSMLKGQEPAGPQERK